MEGGAGFEIRDEVSKMRPSQSGGNVVERVPRPRHEVMV